jgi:hypothetical protein
VSRRTKFLLGIGVIAALVIGWQVAAFAVHDDAFELEGNAINNFQGPPPDPNQAGDDWENVVADPPTDSADERSFAQELDENETIFTGGGSKDPQDIPNWAWKNDAGGLPDKANLQHAFAASYTVGTAPNERELLYFGADRIDGSGDAAIAFWFLQNPVALDPPLPASQGGFSEDHKTGDLLVISNFSNGGVVSTITTYEWNPACTKAGVKVDLNDPPTPNNPNDDNTCGAQNLLILSTSNNASCLGNPTPDNACAVVNGNTTTLPWTFQNKSGTPDNQALKGEFFEGGIDLTDIGLGGQCFATAVAETRTSTSPTSTLKDFTIGKFGSCSADITTQASGSGTVTPGTPVTDTATITGSGTTPPVDPTGTVDFLLCSSTTANFPDCSTGGTDAGTDKPLAGGTPGDGIATAQSDAVNTATSPLAPGKYCFAAVYSGDDNYEGGRHTNTDPASTTGGECFTVSQPTTVSTAQRWTPNDTATVTPAGTAGTVTFRLYDNGTCTGTAIYTESDSSAPFATTNTTFRTDSTTVSWRASFDATNADDSTGVCETTQVTLDNDGP